MRRLTTTWLRSGCAAAVLAALAATARAEEKVGPAIDPKAEQLIQRVSDYLLARRTLRVDVTSTIKVQAEGMNQEMTSRSQIALERPNRVAVLQKGGMMGVTLISDGKQVTTYVPAMKKYQVEPAPAALADLAASPVLSAGQPMPIAATLLAADPKKEILEGVKAGRHLGEVEVDGVRCEHARFEQEEFDWEIWVEAGDRPLIRRIVPDMAKALRLMAEQAGAEGGALAQMKTEMSVVLVNWEVDPEMPADQFVFTPPADAQKVDSLFKRSEAAEASPLAGKPAPPLKLPLLDGGEFDLAVDGKDKVVVLDFWASWCGPCRRALPLVIEVTQAYADKGVLFVAVNQGETAETARKFMEQQKLACRVALDERSTVGKAYGVTGIPQTVLIGKDGRVQAVHVGLLPDLKTRLAAELDALVAGKDLAADTPPGAPPAP